MGHSPIRHRGAHDTLSRPTMTTPAFRLAQDGFYRRYLDAVRALTGGDPLSEDDPENPSPCFVGTVDERGLRPWRPVQRGDETGEFSELERALGGPLHPDTRAWFVRWRSLPVEGSWREETVVLGAAASDADLARLVDVAARCLWNHGPGGEPSVPVAVLYDGRRVRAGNVTGRVWILDADGGERLVAASLADFLDAITPLPL
jgi:hypothetical protein